MEIDADVYLEHFGKKGMKWGSRRASNKSVNQNRSRNQKIAVALVTAGSAFLAARFVGGKTINTKTIAVAGAAAGFAGKNFMDSQINKSGSRTISSLK